MRVKSVKYIRDYILEILFENGKTKTVDLSIFLKEAINPMTTKYRKLKFFKQVKVLRGYLSWNEEMDLSAESLYNWKNNKQH